jgi:hypothetical protein
MPWYCLRGEKCNRRRSLPDDTGRSILMIHLTAIHLTAELDFTNLRVMVLSTGITITRTRTRAHAHTRATHAQLPAVHQNQMGNACIHGEADRGFTRSSIIDL